METNEYANMSRNKQIRASLCKWTRGNAGTRIIIVVNSESLPLANEHV